MNLLLFLLWPFAGFVYALIRPLNKATILYFLVFFFLIGFSFHFLDDTVDSYRYAEDFSVMHGSDAGSLFLYNIILKGKVDFYDSALIILVSRITTNVHILFGIYGMVFGFFIYKLFEFAKRDIVVSFDVYVWILLLCIFLLNPHVNINGVRFWTATWVFMVSVVGYCLYNEKKWIWGLIFTPLFHSSYILCIGLLLITYIIRDRLNFLFVLYCCAFGLHLIGGGEYVFKFFPENLFIFEHYQAYLDESYVAEVNGLVQERSMINRVLSSVPKFYVFLSIIYIRKYIEQFMTERILFSYVLVLLSFCMIFEIVPSMGRFYIVSYMLFIYLLYRLYIQNKCIQLKKMIFVLPIVFSVLMYNTMIIHQSVLSIMYLKGTLLHIIN